MHVLRRIREWLFGDIVADYLDFIAQSTDPATPNTGVARLYAFQYHGITRLRHDNEMATDQVLGEDTVFIVRNSTGATLTRGSVVYVTGDAGNVPTVALAQANALPGARALGVVYDDILDTAFGQVIESGTLESFNTNSWNSGDRLWLSETTPGGLTNVRPVYPNFQKPVGNVLTKGIGNGSILITISAFTGGEETGTNSTTWKFNGHTLSMSADASISGTNTGDQNLSGLVPYSGATGAVDLGTNSLTAGAINANGVLTLADDQSTYAFIFGRYSAGAPYSYVKPSATSSGFKFVNAGATAVTLQVDDNGIASYGYVRPGIPGGGTQSGTGIWANSGVPDNAKGSDGDYYFRSDGGSGTHIYFKSSGSWNGII